MLPLRRKGATSRSTKRLTTISDSEFGDISLRRSPTARYVRIRLMPNGTLSATLPRRAPLRAVQELIDHSRDELRRHVRNSAPATRYADGQSLGHSHMLRVAQAATVEPRHSFNGQHVEVILPTDWQLDETRSQDYLRTVSTKVLRREAEAYLPRRLRYLADQYGFEYTRVRYGNPKGRWGSYSSNGTISLNVALMNLPLDVIDYVLIHELCHSRHPHHQASFWEEVAHYLPQYKPLRAQLKRYSPYL